MSDDSSDSDISMDYDNDHRIDYKDLSINIDEVNKNITLDDTSICGRTCGTVNFQDYAYEKPCDKLCEENFEEHNHIFSISSQKGKKKTQEDRFVVDQEFMGETAQAIFSIFDGHSGSRASQYCKDTLMLKLKEKYQELKENTSSAVQKILQEVDFEFLRLAKEQNLDGGSTCVLGMIMNNKLTIANIGDSTAFLVKNSNVISLTSDHNYSRLDEYNRVASQNLGEFLILKNRLNGQLALSRSIGDLKYRPAVTSEAEIQTINLGSLDQYLILASDGVCSKTFGKRQVTDYIKNCIQEGKTRESISQGIIDQAISNGSQDNITVIIVELPHYYNSSSFLGLSPEKSDSTILSASDKKEEFFSFDSAQKTNTGRRSYNFSSESPTTLNDISMHKKAPSSFSERMGSAVSTCKKENSGPFVAEDQYIPKNMTIGSLRTMSTMNSNISTERKSLSLKEQEKYYRQCSRSKRNFEKRSFGF